MSRLATAYNPSPQPAPAPVKEKCPGCKKLVLPNERTIYETEEFGGVMVFTGHAYIIAVCPECDSKIRTLDEV